MLSICSETTGFPFFLRLMRASLYSLISYSTRIPLLPCQCVSTMTHSYGACAQSEPVCAQCVYVHPMCAICTPRCLQSKAGPSLLWHIWELTPWCHGGWSNPTRAHIAALSSHLKTAPVAGPDCIRNDSFELSLLQCVHGTGSGACWGCHTVLQDCRVLLGGHCVLGRTKDGLEDEGGGNVPGKSHVHCSIHHGLNHHKDVCRAGTSDRCCHVDKLLIINSYFHAQAAQ
mmetsp:Transcript_123126/g.213512  ORF Transcript_123126/g.213512 Transcript_123126/m.213512 type:complete len:229 (-) Transcript_123126:32-718(-)